MIQLISAILYRLDGWGKGDSFLPCWPFNKYEWMKTGGINYARLVIGIPIAFAIHSWWPVITYFVASIIPYGDDSLLEKYLGPLKWLVVGFLFGAASLDISNALWLGIISLISKYFDINHSLWEFGVMGIGGTLIWIWR